MSESEATGNGLSEEEVKNVVEALSKLKVKPQFDSPEAVTKWLAELQYGGAKPKMSPTPKLMKQEIGSASSAPEDNQQAPTPPVAQPSSSLSSHLPKLAIFSGDPTPPKGEVLFDQWKFQVERLRAGALYSEEAILQAVIQSMRGEAGRIVMRLGIHATLAQILKELQDNYGVVRYPTDLLEDFYHAKQKEGESVAAFACRIEDLLNKARQREEMSDDRASLLLRRKLWRGLHTSLRNMTSHKFDTIEDYGHLKEAIRQMEDLDAENTSKPKPSKAAPSVDNIHFKEMKDMIQQLKGEMTDMKKEIRTLKSNDKPGQPPKPRNWNSQRQPKYDKPKNFNTDQQYWNPDEANQGPRCWRCGYFGHLRRDCMVRMDHSRMNLNGRMPTGRGHP